MSQNVEAPRGAFMNENRRRRSRYTLVFALLVLALLVITVLNVNIGTQAIPVGEILRILLGRAKDSTQYSIIWKIRLPRIFMAAILGGALALSGFLMLLALYVFITVERAHSVEYLNGIFEMKDPDTPIWFTQPYIYIANNFDNFNCLVRDLPAHTHGLRILFPLFALTGLKFLFPELVSFPLYVTKEELTTVTLIYDAYYDFGIAGVAVFAVLLGAAAVILLLFVHFHPRTVTWTFAEDHLQLDGPFGSGEPVVLFYDEIRSAELLDDFPVGSEDYNYTLEYLNDFIYREKIDHAMFLISTEHLRYFDPGDEYNKICEYTKNLNIEAILITHYHFDHIGALDKFKNIKIIDYNSEEQQYQIGEFKFEIIKTPGHTEDSISFYFKEEKMMFVGDFVFENTIGRTDLETGNMKDMEKSIEILKTYPIETILYPGHGNNTTIEKEIKNNPFF